MVLSLYGWLIAGISIIFSNDHADSGRQLRKHPFYISVTEISHNAQDKIIEISCKIFADDLETTLSKSSGTKVNLSDQNNKTGNDKMIAAYVMKHLQLKIDDKPVTLQFVGSEKEEDVVWSYFQVNNISTLKKMDIINDILYDLFDSETNLMHVMANGNRQSKKVSKPESHLVFEF
jgi:hypothetical protein